MTVFASLLTETWNVLLVAAPFLLIGMLCAGLVHVLLARRHVERWMGQEGLLAVVIRGLFGIPLPLCSCGVVPVAIALRRKGASRPATLSFLITTPESGTDSILLTWGMLGPVMAIVRPLASLVTALVAGIAAIAWPDGDASAGRLPPPSEEMHGHSADLGDEAHVIGPRRFWQSLSTYAWPARRRTGEPSATAGPTAEADGPPPFDDVIREVCRYAFVEVADDIAFWLVIGLLLAGAISVAVPADLAARGLGSGLMPMLLLLLAGVPLYICASASTPVAAALVAKGLSPGAALVFLLSGPATNAATLLLLARHFGARFLRIYLASIVVATLLCGLALDWLIGMTGWQVQATLTGGRGGVAEIQWLSAITLAVPAGPAARGGRGGVRACTTCSRTWMAWSGWRPDRARDASALLVARSPTSGVDLARGDRSYTCSAGCERFRRIPAATDSCSAVCSGQTSRPACTTCRRRRSGAWISGGSSTRASPVSASSPTWKRWRTAVTSPTGRAATSGTAR